MCYRSLQVKDSTAKSQVRFYSTPHRKTACDDSRSMSVHRYLQAEVEHLALLVATSKRHLTSFAVWGTSSCIRKIAAMGSTTSPIVWKMNRKGHATRQGRPIGVQFGVQQHPPLA